MCRGALLPRGLPCDILLKKGTRPGESAGLSNAGLSPNLPCGWQRLYLQNGWLVRRGALARAGGRISVLLITRDSVMSKSLCQGKRGFPYFPRQRPLTFIHRSSTTLSDAIRITGSGYHGTGVPHQSSRNPYHTGFDAGYLISRGYPESGCLQPVP